MLDGTRISYADLIARAGQMANVLVARGVKPGDRVAAHTEKSVPAPVLYLATSAPARCSCRSTPPIRRTSSTISRRRRAALLICDPARTRARRDRPKVKARVETLGPDGKGSLTDRRHGGHGVRDRRPRQ